MGAGGGNGGGGKEVIGGGGGIAVLLPPSLLPVIGRPFCSMVAEGSSFDGMIAGDMGAAGIMQVSSSSINFIKFIKVKFLSGTPLSGVTLILGGTPDVIVPAPPPLTKLLDIS